MRTIVFASPHCIIDPASGAAVATLDALELLAGLGFGCQAFCATTLDHQEEVCVEELLAEQGLPYETRRVVVAGRPARMLFTRKGRVAVTLFRTVFTRVGVQPEEGEGFLRAWEAFLESNRPEVVVTYGGGAVAEGLRREARRRGIPVVFGLHNFAYHDRREFVEVDFVVVPSRFSQQWYAKRLGLVCHVLPYVIDPRRVCVGKHSAGSAEPDTSPTSRERGSGADRPGEYVTFVNPQSTKGLLVFGRIAAELGRCRPEIPLLVVDSRGRGQALAQTGLDLSGLRNLFGMANTPDPRRFYALTKVLVMPSLWNESFGLVAAEAMTNGIPVVVSSRGALPEVVGQGGVVLEIPARYTPESREVPTAAEVRPWVEAIERLWEDGEYYRRQSEAARFWSARWRPEALAPLYAEFFRNAGLQPGPPLRLKP